MHRICLLLLLLTGCPDDDEATETDHDFDFFSGEGTEWTWGKASCVVYMRDLNQRLATARFFEGGRLVGGGPLAGSGPNTFRRGFYRDGNKLAIQSSQNEVKRFFYDEAGRLSEVVQQQGQGRVLKTFIAYDGSNRMTERYSERDGQFPQTERWTYGSLGGVETQVTEVNGRAARIYVVDRKPSGQVTAVRTWTETGGTTVHELEYTAGRVSHVSRYMLGAPSGDDFYYEYDDKNRIVSRTIAPTQLNEAGARTELVWGEKDVVERRELTANGLLRTRAVYERDSNGDARVRTDSNADGEFDQLQDLRDECYGGPYIPEFAAIFSPRITIEGEPLYRVDP